MPGPGWKRAVRCPKLAAMPLSLLVGTVALSLVGHADSTRAVAKPSVVPPHAVDRNACRLRRRGPCAVRSCSCRQHCRRKISPSTVALSPGRRSCGAIWWRSDNSRSATRCAWATTEHPRVSFASRRGIRRAAITGHSRSRILTRRIERAPVRSGVSPGGDIMIHGLPARQAWVGAAHRDFDWTEGCIAVTNKEIDEIWSAVPVGTPILIKP